MVYAMQGSLAFSTAARRDQVLADLNSQIASREQWGTSTARAEALEIGQHGLIVDARFTSRASVDSLKARIESFATGQRLPLAGSFIDVHDCTHDAANPAPCSGVTRRVW